MLGKPNRIIDDELLAVVRTLPCTACSTRNPYEARAAIADGFDCKSDAHHVKTKGSGGDDVVTNVMPLCRTHHQQWHRIGMSAMRSAFPTVAYWLDLAKEQGSP
jgi:hypothetical protein